MSNGTRVRGVFDRLVAFIERTKSQKQDGSVAQSVLHVRGEDDRIYRLSVAAGGDRGRRLLLSIYENEYSALRDELTPNSVEISSDGVASSTLEKSKIEQYTISIPEAKKEVLSHAESDYYSEKHDVIESGLPRFEDDWREIGTDEFMGTHDLIRITYTPEGIEKLAQIIESGKVLNYRSL
jgi:hypothetical protein